MADELSEKIRSVLSDPQSAAKIAAIASSLGVSGGDIPPSSPSEETAPSVPAAALPLPFNRGNDKNTALLQAIKPFLREDKREKIDSLVRALSVAELISGLKRGGN